VLVCRLLWYICVTAWCCVTACCNYVTYYVTESLCCWMWKRNYLKIHLLRIHYCLNVKLLKSEGNVEETIMFIVSYMYILVVCHVCVLVTAGTLPVTTVYVYTLGEVNLYVKYLRYFYFTSCCMLVIYNNCCPVVHLSLAIQ